MYLTFEFSGIHDTLPASEAKSCLNALGVGFSVHTASAYWMVVEINDIAGDSISHLAERLKNRLSLTHVLINAVLVTGYAGEEDLLRSIDKTIDTTDFPSGLSARYCVRVRTIKDNKANYRHAIVSTDLERKIGALFFRKGYKADLTRPDLTFRALVSANLCIFGIVIGNIDAAPFEERRPQYKPFFYPGVLMPKIARALVNMAEVKPGEILFDPFCGTGGILVEAGLIGVRVIGSDVQRKLLLGAKMNLDYYHADYTLMYQDACRLALIDESVEGIVTDPPYGRSAAVKGESIERLYSQSLAEMYRVLKTGRRAVFVSEKPAEALARDAGFMIVETHTQRVHKSLTRRIYVLMRYSMRHSNPT